MAPLTLWVTFLLVVCLAEALLRLAAVFFKRFWNSCNNAYMEVSLSEISEVFQLNPTLITKQLN